MKIKYLKRIIYLLLATLLVFQSLNIVTYAKVITDKIGANINFSLDTSAKKLTITGSGNTYDYYYSPFEAYSSYIDNVVIGSNVTGIGTRLFNNCSDFKSITLPKSLKTISDEAFRNCSSLESISIGSSVNLIGEKAFSGCTNLKTIDVNSNNTVYKSLNGVLYSYDCKTLLKCPANLSFTEYTVSSLCQNVSAGAFDSIKNISSLIFDVKTINIELQNLSKTTINSITFKNPKCNIDIVGCPSKATVYGVKGSTAQAFAKENSLAFVEIRDETHIHKYTFVETKPTCTKKGSSYYVCECGDTKNSAKLKALGHTYNKIVTPATFTANGKIEYKCGVCKTVDKTRTEVIPLIEKCYLSYTRCNYTGAARCPTLYLYDSEGNRLVKNTDYSCVIQSGRVKVGTYTISVTLKGKYSGSKVLTFDIVPQKPEITSLSSTSNSLTVNFKRIDEQCSGYQIAYGTKDANGNIVYKTVKKANSYTSYKATGLKSKTTYYVKMRSYKIVGEKYYYTSYISPQTIKTK